jgi:hypothetical protein
MSIDRLIAVMFPMDATRLCTTRRAKIVVIILSFLIVPLNIHIFYMIHYFRDDNLGMKFFVTPFHNHQLQRKRHTLNTGLPQRSSLGCYWPCRIPRLFEVEVAIDNPIQSLEIWFTYKTDCAHFCIDITHSTWLRLLVHTLSYRQDRKMLSKFCSP